MRKMDAAVLPPPTPVSPLREDESAAAGTRSPDDELEVEVPSLQLHDVEGRIHKYEGPLSRRTKKAKLKHDWKKRWFRVTPGI